MIKKSVLALLLCFVFLSAYAVEFKGITVGNYMLYYPGTKVKFVEPVVFQFSSGPIKMTPFEEGNLIVSGDMKQLKEEAEKTAKEKGFQNYAISDIRIVTFQTGVSELFADIIFW